MKSSKQFVRNSKHVILFTGKDARFVCYSIDDEEQQQLTSLVGEMSTHNFDKQYLSLVFFSQKIHSIHVIKIYMWCHIPWMTDDWYKMRFDATFPFCFLMNGLKGVEFFFYHSTGSFWEFWFIFWYFLFFLSIWFLRWFEACFLRARITTNLLGQQFRPCLTFILE